jgi:hypothetical protein
MMSIYAKSATRGDKIVEHMKKVEMRGRKKIAFG